MITKSTSVYQGLGSIKLTIFLVTLLFTFTACDNGLITSETNRSDSTAAFESLANTSDKTGGSNCENQVNNNVKKLLDCVTLDGVRIHQAAFQNIADANNGTRVSGSQGYDQSVDYVSNMLSNAGYQVETQEFDFEVWYPIGNQSLKQIAPAPTVYTYGTDFGILTQSAGGSVTATVTPVDIMSGLGNSSTSGCEPSDFAGFPLSSIALIQRGGCTFQIKAENAKAAGAVGVVIFNQGNISDRLGLLDGTLTTQYSGGIPVLGTTYQLGVEWAETQGLVLSMEVNVIDGLTTTRNVFAELPGKNADNVIMAGAHLDAVPTGPGINDNGSGSAAILETAIQMAKVKPENTVRFAWWGAEEFGLIGSDYYVNNLPNEELLKIALYLNFDMIGSPNYVNFIYDGDGSAFGLAGPQGSEEIESFYEDFYSERELNSEPSVISFRSDYAAFFNAGIPFGGVFSGASGIKTPAQAATYGGTAGDQYDPCYHLACDTFDNVSLEALDVNLDAVAHSILHYSMNTSFINGEKAKGNFKAKHEHQETE